MNCANSSRLTRCEVFLLSPKCIADGERILRNKVPPILVRQIIHPADIDLWLDENIRFDIQLHAGGSMDLKMIGADVELALIK